MFNRLFGGAEKAQAPQEITKAQPKMPGQKPLGVMLQEGEDDLTKVVGAAAIEAYESGKQELKAAKTATNVAEYEERALGKSRRAA